VRSLERYVLDTSVIVAYIIENEPGRERAVELLERAARGGVELHVTYYTLSEAIYVASRIYGLAGVGDPNGRANELALLVTSTAKVVEITPQMAYRAGELRKALRLSLADCYVIAAAEQINARALFLRPEREMRGKTALIEKLPVSFLATA